VKRLGTPAVETGARTETAQSQTPRYGQVQAIWPRRSSPWWRYSLRRRLLAGADVTAALLASLFVLIVGNGQVAQLAWALAFLPVWILVAKLHGLYDRDDRTLRHLTVDEIPPLVLWALMGTAGLTLFLELTPAGRPSSSGSVIAGATAALSVFFLRAAARWLWRATTPPELVTIIGTDSAADAFRRKLELFPDVHAMIATVHDPREIDDIARDPAALAPTDRLFFAPDALDEREVRAVLEIARRGGLRLTVIPPCPSAFSTTVKLNHIAELPVLEYNTGNLSRSTLLLKRGLDVTVSATALVLLLPLFAPISAAIKLDSRGEVLFSQLRAGAHGRPFRMRKFRSMVVNAEKLLEHLVPFDRLEEPMFKLPDDPRVTRVGRILRRWSLDELPQLFNVLRGEMSLVGPRPEQIELVDLYTAEQRLRLAVKPGMTGPMQVHGRGTLSLAERLSLEDDYIVNLSFGRDIRILALTVAAVFRGEGAF